MRKENQRKNLKNNTDNSRRYDTITLEKLENENKRQKSSGHVIFIIYLFIILFMSLIVYLIHFQFTQSQKLVSDYRNPMLIEKEKNVKLGNVYASDAKTILATSEKTDNGYNRSYPYGEVFAHPIGYSKNGRTELESSLYQSLLSTGDEDISLIDKIRQMNDEKTDNTGNSVITTLDARLQTVAYNAMGSRKGAVVIMEPKTGKVLTMVSKPSFDPNNLQENWDNLVNDTTNSPLVNRATQGLYPPGSTFKVLTALEYMRENPNYSEYRYDCGGVIERNGLSVACAFNRAHGSLDIYGAMAQSCNGAFIDMGMTLDVTKYRQLVEDFGFNEKLPINDMPYTQSKFSLDKGSSQGEKMQTVFGQGNTLVTPLQNCIIASTIANDGNMMEVQFVDRVLNSSGDVIDQKEPVIYKKVLDIAEAIQVKNMMRGVVTNGLAQQLKNSNYSVACKTGTAQYNNNNNTHNLIIGFAPEDDPQIAFSIVLEGYEGQPQIDNDLMYVTKTILDSYFYR